MSKRAVIYARVSTQEQTKGYSILSQLEACRAHALGRGYTVVGEFTDACSGASLDRPELSKVRLLAAEGAFEVLVVYEMDRLARTMVYQLLLEEELAQLDIASEYVVVNYARSPEGELMKQLRAAISEYERVKIRERTKRGLRGRAKAGLPWFGRAVPYGYRYIPKSEGGRLDVVEEEAEVVRQIFEWAAHGDENGRRLGLSAIASRLSQRGVPTRWDIEGRRKPSSGCGVWGAGSVRGLLRNEVYAGVWYYGRTMVTRNGRRELRPREQWIPVPIAPIISRDLWEAAQEQLRQNSLRWSQYARYQYLLQGRLVCETCGRTFHCCTFASGSKTWGYYYHYGWRTRRRAAGPWNKACRPYLRQDVTERVVWEQVRSILENPETGLQPVGLDEAHDDDSLDVLHAQLASLEKRRQHIEDRISRLLDLHLDGESMAKDLLRRKLEEIAQEKDRVDKEANDLQRHAEAKLRSRGGDIERLRTLCARVVGGVDTLTFEEKRWILDLLDVRASVRPAKKPAEGIFVLRGCFSGPED